jgi:hypothetical protein
MLSTRKLSHMTPKQTVRILFLPFGSPAVLSGIRRGPVVFRPRLSAGLALSGQSSL